MADKVGRKNVSRTQRRRLRFFFINGKLHHTLSINRGADLVTTWSYTDGRIVKYNWTDVINQHKPAFTTKQVGKMLNRGRLALERAIINGNIERPQMTYSIDENRNPFQYMWSEEDIFDTHQYLCTVHYGRPRKDGMISPYPLPTLRELRAMIDSSDILDIKRGEDYTPTWKANT